MAAARQRPLRLLSIDGGGIRGLSSLYIIQSIMKALQNKAGGEGVARPLLPCEYFDLIGGTSTGGLIAIMLGTLRMDIDTCIDEYLNMAPEIFPVQNILSGSRFGVLVNATMGTPRFDPKPLEMAVKRLVMRYLGDEANNDGENTLFKFKTNPGCKVFVCAVSQTMGRPFRFRSYESAWDYTVDCPIWQTCRATSAAPTLFPPMAIGKPPVSYVDGGLGYNNPILPLMDEARHLWPNRDIGCIVSIGSGSLLSKDIGSSLVPLFDSLKAIATDSEKVADEFREDIRAKHGVNQKVYFRLNVQHGLEQVGLEEWNETERIFVATRDYTRREWAQIDACASQLHNPAGILQELEWYHQEGCSAFEAKNYGPACRLFEQALAGRERLLGSDLDETDNTRNCYAKSLFMVGKFRQAEEQLYALVGFSERKHGKDHPETLKRRMSLGEALERCGGVSLPDASEQFRLAAVGWERTIGTQTETAVYCRYKAGLGYSSGEKFSLSWPYWKEGEDNLRRAAEGWKSLRGERDDKALEAQIAYATVLLKKQDDSKALRVFRNALSIAKAKGGPKSHAQVRNIKGGIEECEFWLREGQPKDRLEIARRREAKASQAKNWRAETGHW